MPKVTLRSLIAATALVAAAPLLSAASNPKVGGAVMLPTKTIVENAAQSADHKTLVAAVQAAGLAETLSGPGPFTVFAPTDGAFSALGASTVDTLTRPENKERLTAILTYHVVPGAMTAKMINAEIRKGKGKATLTTVQGRPLTVRTTGGMLILTDARGSTSMVTIKDVMQSNGVIHVVDTVLMP